MGLTVADVVELPKNKPMSNEKYNKWDLEARGYNQCLSEISSLPLSPEKVVGMIMIDREGLCEEIMKHNSWGKRANMEIADAIISNKSKILGLKK